MTKDEALHIALETLEYAGPSWIEARQPAITAIKAALEAKDETFKPDYNTEAVLVEEMQRMAKRIEDLQALLERQTARIVELQEHIENFEGEDR